MEMEIDAAKILLEKGIALCEEASPLSKDIFIPCLMPAVAIVDNGDSKSYFMCFGCADHNERNRGAKILVRKKMNNGQSK